MDLALILNNLLSPPILFFILGMTATLVKSDLEIPQSVAKFLSIYLLFSIGIEGGVKLAQSGLTSQVLITLGVAVAMGFLVPIWSFFILRMKVDVHNAAAIAACYGSISAVTFITAQSFLQDQDIAYSSYLVAAMALMESPAIIVGVVLLNLSLARDASSGGIKWKSIAHEALFGGPVLLLLGSLAIGTMISTESWEKEIYYFAKAPLKGMLCLFLLDMGLVAAKRLGDLKKSGSFLIGFSLISPPIHAALGIVVSKLIGLSVGDALLMAVLVGSASYIAVPAAVRLAIPKANPSIYVPMSLALTFPFNISIGIPLYMALIKWMWN